MRGNEIASVAPTRETSSIPSLDIVDTIEFE